jgi:hypothetical protein
MTVKASDTTSKKSLLWFIIVTLLIWTILDFFLSLAWLDNGLQMFAILAMSPFGTLKLLANFAFAVMFKPVYAIPIIIGSFGVTYLVLKALRLLLFSAKSALIGNIAFFLSLLLLLQITFTTVIHLTAMQNFDGVYCLRKKSSLAIILSGPGSVTPHAALYTNDRRYLWSFKEMKFIQMDESIFVVSHEKACRQKLKSH